jgi:hypothetical protein
MTHHDKSKKDGLFALEEVQSPTSMTLRILSSWILFAHQLGKVCLKQAEDTLFFTTPWPCNWTHQAPRRAAFFLMAVHQKKAERIQQAQFFLSSSIRHIWFSKDVLRF